MPAKITNREEKKNGLNYVEIRKHLRSCFPPLGFMKSTGTFYTFESIYFTFQKSFSLMFTRFQSRKMFRSFHAHKLSYRQNLIMIAHGESVPRFTVSEIVKVRKILVSFSGIVFVRCFCLIYFCGKLCERFFEVSSCFLLILHQLPILAFTAINFSSVKMSGKELKEEFELKKQYFF